jgi:hypothetical protein
MAVIEEFLEVISIKSTLVVLLVGSIIYYMIYRLNENYRLKQLGARAPKVACRLPLGKYIMVSVNMTRA